MAFDFRKLKGRIIQAYGAIYLFAKKLGISNNSFSRKLNNKVRFSVDDIVEISSLLDIPPNEIGAYFFTEKV